MARVHGHRHPEIWSWFSTCDTLRWSIHKVFLKCSQHLALKYVKKYNELQKGTPFEDAQRLTAEDYDAVRLGEMIINRYDVQGVFYNNIHPVLVCKVDRHINEWLSHHVADATKLDYILEDWKSNAQEGYKWLNIMYCAMQNFLDQGRFDRRL